MFVTDLESSDATFFRASDNSLHAFVYSSNAIRSFSSASGKSCRASTFPSSSCRNDIWQFGREYADIPCLRASEFQSAKTQSTSSIETPAKAIFSNVVIKLFELPSIDLAHSFKDASASFSSSCVFSIVSNRGLLMLLLLLLLPLLAPPPLQSSLEMLYKSFLVFSKATNAELGDDRDASDSYADWAETSCISTVFISSRKSIKFANRESPSSSLEIIVESECGVFPQVDFCNFWSVVTMPPFPEPLFELDPSDSKSLYCANIAS
mmetsp:Transcript_39392/g.84948  ORF Transcript_39392/g.84948 Transcript_39392/m.84948 type:complete len:265 (+) Transcript_39392:2028-2822(+)